MPNICLIELMSYLKRAGNSSVFFNDTLASDASVVAKRSCLIELQFFPKTEKYVSLFTGGDDSDIVDRRNKLRKQIKANLVAAAASGKDLEGTYFAQVPFSLCHILGIDLFFLYYLAQSWS